MDTVDILKDLIGFTTVSADPNRPLIDHCAVLLRDAGAEVTVIEAEGGAKANLYATIGPRDRPGVLLSGHTDVVPVDGQAWTVPPFELTEADGKLYGRGATDMKGFVAATLAAALRAARLDLATPLHLALSHDEEVGCIGVRSLIDMLAEAPVRPLFCIVGEPTEMAVATGHKGKRAWRVTCTGREGHSAMAPAALNAIHLACDLIADIRAAQSEIEASGARDSDYDVPYSTLHVGRIGGGTALNIVPNRAQFEFEVRNLPEDDPDALRERIVRRGAALLAPVQRRFPEAEITLETMIDYPPLATDPASEPVAFVKGLTGANRTIKMPYGTEGGLFSRRLGLPTVICGPGALSQMHKPDEFITRAQLDQCDAMLDALIARLARGI